ncbi:diadenosine tetraphosphate (Ap4A) HIT family hydrolase [Oceanihabitans sediminis]|uniref:HIT family protein n=1 Tax=Oceanihabitans sediminis TaxID=1812012 RepID=A0A368P5W8_9FLAO|nr:HIT family protein [Oceanihabitans sediminis]RBP34218.1 diadenosine tetraphosphate (Ap4A) HIT family hydrolase [Oceanihabitans sediminis]RCU57908.1 HIT family protein [Oceanihabitans sediminis]
MSVFSNIEKERKIYQGKYFFLIEDGFPVSPGHILIISNQEKLDYFQLEDNEKAELTTLIDKAKELIENKYSPDGYNIGMNCGEAAGQSVMHFHCHVIPRYIGDMENPRGGVRHCVEGKGNY